jgi:hypothetical protein
MKVVAFNGSAHGNTSSCAAVRELEAGVSDRARAAVQQRTCAASPSKCAETQDSTCPGQKDDGSTRIAKMVADGIIITRPLRQLWRTPGAGARRI